MPDPANTRTDHEAAAPPDAGGHLGSGTRPEDLLQGSHPASREPRAPALARDAADGGKGAGGSVPSFLLYGALIALVVSGFWYVFGPG